MPDTPHQPALFAQPDEAGLSVPLEPGELRCWQPLLGPQAGDLARHLYDSLDWQQPTIRLFGKEHRIPRLQVWMGDPEARYRYSGLELEPEPWTGALADLRNQVQDTTGKRFNSVLLNLYRHGQDAMGWHSDDEPELGPQPWIASYNLGATRRFCLRHKTDKRRHEVALQHDQLMLMSPQVQHHWQHALPRTRRVSQWRINLTFRRVLSGR